MGSYEACGTDGPVSAARNKTFKRGRLARRSRVCCVDVVRMAGVSASGRVVLAQTPSRWLGGLTAWLAIGAGVGIGGAVLARVAPWPLAALPHYAAPYVLLLIAVGAAASTARSAAVTAAGCFLVFVLAYYLVVMVQFGAVPVLYAGAWALAAVTICPLAAAAVSAARLRAKYFAAVVSAAAGAVALSDGAVGNLIRIAVGRGDPAFAQPVLAVADLLVAGVALAVIPRRKTTRVLAVALLIPFAIVTTYAGWALHFGTGPYL